MAIKKSASVSVLDEALLLESVKSLKPLFADAQGRLTSNLFFINSTGNSATAMEKSVENMYKAYAYYLYAVENAANNRGKTTEIVRIAEFQGDRFAKNYFPTQINKLNEMQQKAVIDELSSIHSKILRVYPVQKFELITAILTGFGGTIQQTAINTQQNEQPAQTGTQQHEQQAPEASFNREKIVSNYVRLLRANEKWRNHSRIKFLRGRAKTGGLNDSDLINKDGNLTSEAKGIQKKFVEYAKHILNSQTGNNVDEIKDKQLEAIKSVYNDVSSRLHDEHKNRRLWADKLRSGGYLWGRILLGAALFGVGVFLGGWIGALALGLAGAIGAVGRFLAVDGIMDKMHGYLSGRKDTARAMANQVMYNANHDRIDASVHNVYNKRVGLGEKTLKIADDINKGFMQATDTLSKYRFWKRLTAVTAAVVPIAVVKYFGIGHTETPTKPSIIENQPIKPPVVHAYPDHYVVPDKGGYWHIGRQILHDRLGDKFDALPTGEKNDLINSMHRYLIDNHAKLGIAPNEMHSHVGAGAPWLNKGADLFFKDADWQTAYSQFMKAGKQLPKSLLSGNSTFTNKVISGVITKAKLVA
ncbi:MAG: hypothetical protein NTV88_05630 [Candidatus Micrarchaeota archaeon]|nr:hypothetical protein [Candidatus Micrarchaeota archaeon]